MVKSKKKVIKNKTVTNKKEEGITRQDIIAFQQKFPGLFEELLCMSSEQHKAMLEKLKELKLV